MENVRNTEQKIDIQILGMKGLSKSPIITATASTYNPQHLDKLKFLSTAYKWSVTLQYTLLGIV